MYEPPYLYDGWLCHGSRAERHYIRHRRLCLALSVFMCLGRERYYYDVLDVPVNFHICREGIKEDIQCELLCLSIKIPPWFLLQLVPWPGSN